jgi:hydrogenase maturation protease
MKPIDPPADGDLWIRIVWCFEQPVKGHALALAFAPRILIACIGSDLAADDGVGHAVYQRLLRSALPEHVGVEFFGLGGLQLVEQLAGEQMLIVVDAVQLGTEPGRVHLLDLDDLPTDAGFGKTAHQMGLTEALQLGRRLAPQKMPLRVVLVGVEGRVFDRLDQALSPEVEAAVTRAVEVVLNEVDKASAPVSGR